MPMVNVGEKLNERAQQLREQGFAKTLAAIVMAEPPFGRIEGAVARSEAARILERAIDHATGIDELARERGAELKGWVMAGANLKKREVAEARVAELEGELEKARAELAEWHEAHRRQHEARCRQGGV